MIYPKELIRNKENEKFINSLPEIYIVGFWAKYGVMGFPLVKWKKKDNYMIPMVYQYDDHNGTTDSYYLREIEQTTTGYIVCWTDNENVAERIAEGLNLLLEKDKEKYD